MVKVKCLTVADGQAAVRGLRFFGNRKAGFEIAGAVPWSARRRRPQGCVAESSVQSEVGAVHAGDREPVLSRDVTVQPKRDAAWQRSKGDRGLRRRRELEDRGRNYVTESERGRHQQRPEDPHRQTRERG